MIIFLSASIDLTSSKEKKKLLFLEKIVNKHLINFIRFFFSLERNDGDMAKMATDELLRLRTNLNSIDNEVKNNYSILVI